jgi:uncharacterized protein (DUF58 family)
VIQLILDTDPHVHAGSAENGSREWAIRVVASLAKGWLEAGAQVGLTWAGFDLPPASGPAQCHKVLDTLAALPDDAGGPLSDLLACPVCQKFRDGLQVIVTTDRAHLHSECGACAAEDQRWVILNAGGFADTVDIAPTCGHGPCAEPWLRIDSADVVPARLRGGWREARHGS